MVILLCLLNNDLAKGRLEQLGEAVDRPERRLQIRNLLRVDAISLVKHEHVRRFLCWH